MTSASSDSDAAAGSSRPGGELADESLVPTRYLRSGLEFAVLVAREGPKLKPPLAIPQSMRRYVKTDRLSPAALNGVRRVLESEDEFRSLIGVGATDELVDEVGRLWLQRPDGWQRLIATAIDGVEREAHDADLARQLKRAEKRREAAERAAARSVAELVERDARLSAVIQEVDELRTELNAVIDERSDLAAQLEQAKMAARHARDRELAASDRERSLREERDQLADRLVQGAGSNRDAEVAAVNDGVDVEAVHHAADAAAELAASLAALVSPNRSTTRSRDADVSRPVARRPLKMPPGVLGSSLEGARFLLRSGAPVIVDGYNVSKLAWARLDLEAQRDRLVTALEMVSRRYGTELIVVFDGADVVGAHGGRNTGVRVVFSSPAETADDWIRAETRRLVAGRPVVVVTNDREIIDGVTADGANHLSSQQLIDLLD